MTTRIANPASLRPESADLARARNTLLEAELADTHSEAYLAAHRAALQGAAVVFRGCGRPLRGSAQPVQMWHLLSATAPELGEWAAFFELVQPRVRAAASGLRVGQRQADDLVRDAEAFLDAVTEFFAHPHRSGRRSITRSLG